MIYDDYQENRTHSNKPQKGTQVKLRNAVEDNDSSWPTAGSGVDCTGYKYALVDVIITGTSVSWSVSPGFYNSTAEVYVPGVAETVTTTTQYTVEVNGCDDFYTRVYNKSGTTTITVYVTPYN